MDQTIERRIAGHRAEDLARLAGQGERNGVRILVDHRTGQHVATSASDPTACYLVDVERGCSCKGWAVWNRCQHHSLLLAELGLIPDVDPEPEPEPTVTLVIAPPVCAPCRGRGWVYVTHDDDAWPVKTTCGRCAGQPAHADGLDRWGHALPLP